MLTRALPAALLALLSVALVHRPAAAAAPSPTDSAKAVFVGHSLINNEVPALVKAIAESKGKVSRTAVQWYIGAPIRYNWLHCRSWQLAIPYPPPAFACDEIERGTDIGAYDALIIAESNNPIIDPRNPDYIGDTSEYFTNFLDLFLDRNGSGRAYFYTAWEGQGSPFHQGADWTTRIAPELGKFERDVRMVQERELATRGRNVTVPVIPVNVALRDVILAAESGNFPGITNRQQLFTDDVHLSPIGYYIAACTVYASIYQQSPEGATPADIDPAIAARIQSLTWNVVANYRGWGGSSPPPAPTRPRAPTGLIVR